MRLCVLVVVASAVLVAGFNPRSLSPDLDELQALSQVVASVRESSVSRDQYSQLVTAESLLVRMQKQMAEDHVTDQQQTAAAQAGVASEIASLEITAQKTQQALERQQGLVRHLESAIATASDAKDEVWGNVEDKRSQVELTKSECHSTHERFNQRAQAARDDMAVAERLLEKVDEVSCEEVSSLLQQLALSSSIALPRDSALLVQLETERCTCKDCECAHRASNAPHTEPHAALSCEARRQNVRSLLEALHDLLYSAASQDAHTFELNLKACDADAQQQLAAIDALTAKHNKLSSDVGTLQSQLPDLTAEAAALNTSLTGLNDALTVARNALSSHTCRFNKRSAMRTKQSQTMQSLIDAVTSLMSSPYAPHHLDLTTGCPNNCSAHGDCFNGECTCAEGWGQKDCSVRTTPRECPFSGSSSPCTAEACADVDFSLALSSHEGCANAVCAYCRDHYADDACARAPLALFCAERDRRLGCDSIACPAVSVESGVCGVKRSIRDPLTGCCFNPVLDCEDKCAQVQCPSVAVTCPAGKAVRYPLRDCCFNHDVDCVDECAVAKCADEPPSCPAGQAVRTPFLGCCFDAAVDCEDACTGVVCDDLALPEDTCRTLGKRWSGKYAQCCFQAETDCVEGDAPNQADERTALIALYNAADGQNWSRNSGWNSDGWICYWEGVTCSATAQGNVVTALDLAANNLKGTLPAALAHLASLQLLDLSRNHLTGPLLPDLAELSALNTLRLRSNELTGEVPNALGELRQLQIVDIANNYLTGTVPTPWAQSDGLSFTCSGNCFCDGACAPRHSSSDVLSSGTHQCDPCPQV